MVIFNSQSNIPIERRSKQQLGTFRAGFTLIELLVVIAIIAILASLSLAALSGAKAKADLLVCLNNTKQLTLGIMMYAEDHSKYPAGRSYQGNGTWVDVLESYTSAQWPDNVNHDLGIGSSIFSCPGYNKTKSKYYKRIFNNTAYPPSGAYAYNIEGASLLGSISIPTPGQNDVELLKGLGLGGEFTGWPPKDSHIRLIAQNRVKSPSQMIGIGDALIITPFETRDDTLLAGFTDLSYWLSGIVGNAVLVESGGNRLGPRFEMPSVENAKAANIARHRNRYNVGFLDGHVENFRPLELFDISNPNVRRMWNNDNEPHPERAVMR